MSTDYFPQGIAAGKAFLGRQDEMMALKHNIEHGHHTLLLAPRRFGKTSLAKHTLASMSFSYVEMNFVLSKTAKAVEKKLLEGIQQLLSDTVGNQGNLLTRIASFFARSKKNWGIGLKGLAYLEIVPENEKNIADNILTALDLLENVLSENQKKAVFFLDEMQALHYLEEKEAIEGAIREFAQKSTQVIFIFSGSNRRILHAMFDDKAMPLYELCERIRLKRINESVYQDYIHCVALETWRKTLSEACFQTIFTLTECHPKRIYNLCYQIWKEASECESNTITPDFIESCWLNYMNTRTQDVRYRLSQLNTSQLKTLTLVAMNTLHPTGREAQNKADLSGSAIAKALSFLEEEDYIERHENKAFSVIDPLIKEVIVRRDSFNVD